jgi:WASH complex subunit 7
MIYALRDPLPHISLVRHADSSLVAAAYVASLLHILRAHFLDRLCRDIETDLRLSIHFELKQDQSKLFKDGLKDLARFVSIQPICIHDQCIDVKTHVKRYLDKTFYDLTTIALHDWKVS